MAIEQLYAPDRYAGDGTQTEFPVSFVFHDVAWLRVTLTTGGVDAELENGTDFTGAIAGGGVGGSVTLALPPAPGTTVTVWMDVPRTQPAVLPSMGFFDLKGLERMLDRATLQIQQLADGVARAVKTTVTSTTTPDQLMDDINVARGDAVDAAASASMSAVDAASSAGDSQGAQEAAESARDAAIAALDAAVSVVLSSIRDVQAGGILFLPSLTVPVLADGLPLGLPLDGAVVSLATYPRLSRALCPPGNNGWSPAWYRCTAGGARDVAGGYIRLDDWRGGFPQVLDAGAGRAKSTVLVNTTNGSANVTIVNNLSAGGTLTTPYTGSDGIYPGLAVSGAGIPAGATVVSVAGTTVTLSAACTATGGSVEVTITGRVLGGWQGDAERPVIGQTHIMGGGVATGPFSAVYAQADRSFSASSGSSLYIMDFNFRRVVPTAPTSRPAGPVANAIILV